jgi:hypothetical protein
VPDNALFEPAAGAVGRTNAFAAPPTQADAYEYHAAGLQKWMAEQRASGVAAGTNDPVTGWPTQKGLVDAVGQYANGILLGTTAPGAKGFTAYHGSPHSFDQFKTEAIGTGEGAQAYGHGLYFAENEGVARSYRDGLSPPANRFEVDGKPVGMDLAGRTGLTPEQAAASRVVAVGFDQAVAANDKLRAMGGPFAQTADRLAPHLEALRGKNVSVVPQPTGHMYEVNVNADPAHFLDWDKPLAEQSAHVQKALKSANIAHPIDDAKQLGSAIYHRTQDKIMRGDVLPDSPGNVDLSVLQAQALHQAGIPGIRYLDGGSRADGKGSSNHVIFDPATIAILRKYGIAGLMAGGAAAGTQTKPTQ